MLVNVPQGLVTFDWADGGDIWQDVHPHDNEEVLMEQCKHVKALGTGATADLSLNLRRGFAPSTFLNQKSRRLT